MPNHSDGKFSSGGFKLDSWVTTPATEFKYGVSEAASSPSKVAGRSAATGQFVPAKPRSQSVPTGPGFTTRDVMEFNVVKTPIGHLHMVGEGIGPKPKAAGGYRYNKRTKKNPTLLSRPK